MQANRSANGQAAAPVALALGAIAVVAAAALFLNRPSASDAGDPASPVPSAPASYAPSAPASPAPSAPSKPSASPSDVLEPPEAIELESASGHRVTADVIDQVGSLVDGRSGHPGDGMSVRWHDSIVRQVAPNAIEITWVAFPRDEEIGLGIHDLDGPLTVVIVQSGPYANTDAMGEDRVVVLTFDEVVEADDVVVEVIDKTIDE
jgi:hypothetical protein